MSLWIMADDRPTTPKFYYFSKTFSALAGAALCVRACGDTRYALYLNGTLVLEGPCQGTAYQTYFESADLTPYLKEGEIVIFGGGLGQPYFSTDTAASLRAAQIQADAILLAKNIDGIYDRDPNGPDGKNAVKYDTISCSTIISKKLHAIDLTAAALNMESKIPSVAFALNEPENILLVAKGNAVGTVITTD